MKMKYPFEDEVFNSWKKVYDSNLSDVKDKDKAIEQTIREMVRYFLHFDTINKKSKK